MLKLEWAYFNGEPLPKNETRRDRLFKERNESSNHRDLR